MKNLFFLIIFFIVFIAVLALKANWENLKDNHTSREYRKDVEISHPQSELENNIIENPKTSSGHDFVVNLENTKNRYIVKVDTLSFNVSDVDVGLIDKELNITFKVSNTESRRGSENPNYQYLSRYMGEIVKTITLSDPVDKENISTEFKEGVLTVTIPKKN